MLAADGLWSTLRANFSDDEPVCSGYVAYRGAIPLSEAADLGELSLEDVVVYFGPGCHFVQYPLRQGDLLNQVAVFASPAYQRGEEDWGGPDELEAVFSRCCAQVRGGTAKLGRERRWPMFDRLPISNWVQGRLALTGDAAHPMLQYLAQGACQAIEDAWTLCMQAPSRRFGRPGRVAGGPRHLREAPHRANRPGADGRPRLGGSVALRWPDPGPAQRAAARP